MERKFTRKSNDKIFGGVCSGLADYTGYDKSLIRVIALVGIIATGVLPGLFLYLLCVIIVPDDQPKYDHYSGGSPHYEERDGYSTENGYESGRGSGNPRILFGTVMIAAGVFILVRMFFGWLDWRYLFAGILIIAGLYMFFGNRR